MRALMNLAQSAKLVTAQTAIALFGFFGSPTVAQSVQKPQKNQSTASSSAPKDPKTKDQNPDLEAQKPDTIIMPGHFASQAVNFQYVLENSEIPVSDLHGNKIAVDLNIDDAFTRALKTIEKNVDADIQGSQDIQDLLDKGVWNKQDRVKWEKFISESVSKHLATTPGLEYYRSHEYDQTPESSITEATTRHSEPLLQNLRNLNELSSDIETGKNVHFFHCKMMAATEGIVLQRVENKHIAVNENDASNKNWKHRANYFFVSGNVSQGDEPESHAFIVSGLTGNIIESTVGSKNTISPYMESHDQDYSFRSFVEEGTFIESSGLISYSTKVFRKEFDFISDLNEIGKTPNKGDSGLLGYDFLRNRLQIGGSSISTIMRPDITFKITDTPDIQGLYAGASAIDFSGEVAPMLFWQDRLSSTAHGRVGLISGDPGFFIDRNFSQNIEQPTFQTVRPGMEDHHFLVDGLFGAQYQNTLLTGENDQVPFPHQVTGGVDFEGNPYASGKFEFGGQPSEHVSADIAASGSYIGERDTFRVDGLFGLSFNHISLPFNLLVDADWGIRGTHEFSGDAPVSLATTYAETELYTQGVGDFWKSHLSGVFGAYANTDGDSGVYAGPRFNYGPTSIGFDAGYSEDRREFLQASLKWTF